MIRTAALVCLLAVHLQDAQPQQSEGVTRPQTAATFAETLVAAGPAERTRLLAENFDQVNTTLTHLIAMRAARAAGARQFDAALALYEIALEVARAARDLQGESDTLQAIGNSHYFLREFDAAEQAYRRRLAIARDTNDREALAAATVGVATVAYSRSEYVAALESYREAFTIYQALGNAAAIGSTLVSIANVEYLQAEYDAAARDYRAAIELLARRDISGVALARSGLGLVFAAQGDLASALDAYEEVLSDARTRRLQGNVASALESIGEVQYRLRNVDQARTSFEEARGLADSSGDLAAAGRLLCNLGLTELVAGRFDRALAAYSESRARFEQAELPDEVARAWVGIGFSRAALENFSEAMAAYRTAIDAFDRAGRPEDSARAWLGLSLAQSSAGDPRSALDSAMRVRRLASKARSEDLQWRAAVREGESLDALSRLDEAERAFKDAIAAIEKLAADAPLSAELRADLDESDTAWTGLAFTLAARGDAAGAVEAEERRRAHLRRLALAAAERDIAPGMLPDERQAEQQTARDLISARAQVRAEGAMRKPDQRRRARLDRQLLALTTARRDRQAAVYARLPALRRWRGLDPPPRVEDVRSLLPDARTIALEYVASDNRLLILAISRTDSGVDVTSTIVPFKRREFAASLARALETSALRDATEWMDRSRPLAAALLAPISGRLADKDRVVVIPDDLLWKVPFEALVVRDSELAAVARVTYATSFATWLQQAALAPAGSGVVAVSDPELPRALRDRLARTLPGWAPPDATAAMDQSDAIRAIYASRAHLTSGADATETAVRTGIESADVIHLAAPLHVTGASPLFSAVLLADGDSTPASDGRWEVREWFASDGHPRVMVLPDGASLGAANAGAAMDVLAWAAAAAGVPSLVMGRWPSAGFDQTDVIVEMYDWLAHIPNLTPIEAWGAGVAIARARARAPSAWSGLRFIGAE
jgi:tetratricopeptide (TPR) repeat protein